MSAPASTAAQQRVRIAARALGRHGLAQAYGHCSERLDAGRFLVCAAKPMGLIGPADEGREVTVEGALPEGVLGEVRLHQHIYRGRPEVGAIVRCMPPALMALSTVRLVPRPLHGPGAYFGAEGPALWDDPQLLRDDAGAAAVARTLGRRSAVVMRGNGVVVAAPDLLQAVTLAWYLEDAARMELALRSAGLDAQGVRFTAEECARRATGAGGIFERMGQYLCAGDPEGSLA